MRFVLHGATNWKSSNFGDFIYVYEICRYLKQYPNNQVNVYEPSEYFIKHLRNGGIALDSVKLNDADYLIYVPGGYFGEGHNARIRDTLIQYIRFMPFGLKAVKLKKKLIIVGVGAGPIKRWFLKSAIKKICKNSISVTTRDVESQKALQHIGVNNISEYSDMMLAYDLESIAKETDQIQSVKSFVGDSQLLLIHYNHSYEALEKFALAAIEFEKTHNNYRIVVAADSILPYEKDYFEKFRELCKFDIFHFIYDDPFEMLKLIEISNTILTCKLHVGVAGCMFNKAVICAAEHPEKTMRFYKLIGSPQNCVSLYDSTANQISNKLNNLHTTSLSIPAKETGKSLKHWYAIQCILDNNYEE